MFTSKDFKVELINADEVKDFVKKHGRFACVCYDTDEKYAERVGLSCLQSGHMSGSRGNYFEFKITVVPRSEVDQAVRHEIGVCKNVQSLRYVEKRGVNLYAPPEVVIDYELSNVYKEVERFIQEKYNTIVDILNKKDITGEKANEIARHILPIGIESAYVMGLNLEGLINFMNKRLCKCAEYPIRMVALMMRDEVLKVAPIYKDYLVPICEKNLWCPENETRSCGKKPTKDKLKEILK